MKYLLTALLLFFTFTASAVVDGVPEGHDFQFELNNVKYAVGVQFDPDETYLVLTTETLEGWKWVVITQGVEYYLNAPVDSNAHRKPLQLLTNFIDNKANPVLPTVDENGKVSLPPHVNGALKELMLLIRDKLKIENSKIVITE